MPKASKQTASESMTLEGYEGHFEELGGYTVGFETYTADADLAPLFVGLPDGRSPAMRLYPQCGFSRARRRIIVPSDDSSGGLPGFLWR